VRSGESASGGSLGIDKCTTGSGEPGSIARTTRGKLAQRGFYRSLILRCSEGEGTVVYHLRARGGGRGGGGAGAKQKYGGGGAEVDGLVCTIIGMKMIERGKEF